MKEENSSELQLLQLSSLINTPESQTCSTAGQIVCGCFLMTKFGRYFGVLTIIHLQLIALEYSSYLGFGDLIKFEVCAIVVQQWSVLITARHMTNIMLFVVFSERKQQLSSYKQSTSPSSSFPTHLINQKGFASCYIYERRHFSTPLVQEEYGY